MRNRVISLVLVLGLVAIVLPEVRADPPPWAPAHGYHHKHDQGVDLVFDSGLGLYLVVGFPNIFFSREYFYQKYNGKWQSSTSFKGPWTIIDSEQLPPGLRKNKGEGKGKSKNKGKRK